MSLSGHGNVKIFKVSCCYCILRVDIEEGLVQLSVRLLVRNFEVRKSNSDNFIITRTVDIVKI